MRLVKFIDNNRRTVGINPDQVISVTEDNNGCCIQSIKGQCQINHNYDYVVGLLNDKKPEKKKPATKAE